jgi:hypothetical protein
MEQHLADLIDALEKLASASTDWSAANSARHYLGLLERASSDQIERILSRLGQDLRSKSDLADGHGQQAQAYWAAFEDVRRLTLRVMNQVVALRRPDLAYSIRED